jgi:DNA-binding transcriptional MocR family regulator
MSDTLLDKYMVKPEEWKLAPHVGELSTSIIREILKISSQPGVISFAGGLPAPEMFPLDELRQAAMDVIDEYQSASMQYSLSMGITPLREAIAERESSQGAPTKTENILITSGSQQGIELCARAFIDPGDYIITEYPTYVGALQAFNFYQTRYAPVEMDDDGMIVDQVETAIKRYNPKMIYAVATFQNPTGITMTLERRQALVDIASKYNIPLIDDNPYSSIRFSGENLPSLKELGGDIVIALGTFSKICAPGLRVAWMNATEKILSVFEKVKQCADLHTNTFTQFMINNFIRSGKIDEHITRLIKNYGDKRNLMLEEMEKHFPPEIKWTRPEGGLFLWCELPKSMSASNLLNKAIEEKVAYVYGSPFYPDGKNDNTFRLNFSNATLDTISEGIKRLGKVFQENMP